MKHLSMKKYFRVGIPKFRWEWMRQQEEIKCTQEWSVCVGGVGCGNKMIMELQKKWEAVQDQIYILKNLVLDAKTRNEGNKN